MSIFKSTPSPVEALVQLRAENAQLKTDLEAIQANSTTIQASLDAALKTAGEHAAKITDLEASLSTANTTISERDASLVAANATIADLNKKLADDEGRISERAQALLAASGHAAPLNVSAEGLNTDGTIGQPENNLHGLERVRASFSQQFNKSK